MNVFCKSCGQKTACDVPEFNPYDYIITLDGQQAMADIRGFLEYDPRTRLYSCNEWKKQKIYQALWDTWKLEDKK